MGLELVRNSEYYLDDEENLCFLNLGDPMTMLKRKPFTRDNSQFEHQLKF
jgi:hypothetical protein